MTDFKPELTTFKEWPMKLWCNFRVTQNEHCESCHSFIWDIRCSASAGDFTLAQVESKAVGELICRALDRLRKEELNLP